VGGQPRTEGWVTKDPALDLTHAVSGHITKIFVTGYKNRSVTKGAKQRVLAWMEANGIPALAKDVPIYNSRTRSMSGSTQDVTVVAYFMDTEKVPIWASTVSRTVPWSTLRNMKVDGESSGPKPKTWDVWSGHDHFNAQEPANWWETATIVYVTGQTPQEVKERLEVSRRVLVAAHDVASDVDRPYFLCIRVPVNRVDKLKAVYPQAVDAEEFQKWQVAIVAASITDADRYALGAAETSTPMMYRCLDETKVRDPLLQEIFRIRHEGKPNLSTLITDTSRLLDYGNEAARKDFYRAIRKKMLPHHEILLRRYPLLAHITYSTLTGAAMKRAATEYVNSMFLSLSFTDPSRLQLASEPVIPDHLKNRAAYRRLQIAQQQKKKKKNDGQPAAV
jgi:hypothetical protein